MENIKNKIPRKIRDLLEIENLTLRPVQTKSINSGLFKNERNQLIVTPTGSGKTLVAEMAALNCILFKKKKVIYIVPLKALASEKYKEFIEKYSKNFKIRISIGELQNEKYNYDYDILLTTQEKLDSLIRHDKSILDNLGLLIIDEIHLLNDEMRGPTLEILITIFKTRYPFIRLIGLSATIGNPVEISKWLNAILIYDDFRPTKLNYSILFEDNILRYK